LEQHRDILAWETGADFMICAAAPSGSEWLRLASSRVSDKSIRKAGYIDHQTLSFDAPYAKFIEDDFLNSQRIDPQSDGRPDPDRRARERATNWEF